MKSCLSNFNVKLNFHSKVLDGFESRVLESVYIVDVLITGGDPGRVHASQLIRFKLFSVLVAA